MRSTELYFRTLNIYIIIIVKSMWEFMCQLLYHRSKILTVFGKQSFVWNFMYRPQYSWIGLGRYIAITMYRVAVMYDMGIDTASCISICIVIFLFMRECGEIGLPEKECELIMNLKNVMNEIILFYAPECPLFSVWYVFYVGQMILPRRRCNNLKLVFFVHD